MKITKMKINKLKPDNENARTHADKNIEAIKKSLDNFGQQKPIVIDKNNMVVAGNGTLEAAKYLGWEEIDVVSTSLTGNELRAFAIADNRTGELSDWDLDKLSSILEELTADKTIDEFITGFDPVDMDRFGSEFEPTDVDEEWKNMPEFDQQDKTAYRSITVHFHNEEAIKDFEEKLDLSLPKKARYLWLPEIIIEKFSDKAYESSK